MDIISSSPDLSPQALALIEVERTTPITVIKDTSIRCKVGDACGLTCIFCHNEGTPVIPSQRQRGRVSIYEESNGVSFTSGMMEPNRAFVQMLDNMIDVLGTTEVHWTGGEPTLNLHLVELTQITSNLGLTVKMTSNGELGERNLEKLYAAGLRGITFSIFGTTPEELAQVQGPLYSNKAFASRQILKLNSAIRQAMNLKLPVNANIVMSGTEHEVRILRLLEKYSGTSLHIRILDDLGVGFTSSISIYNLLAKLEVTPVRRKIIAGASGSIVYYKLLNGQEIGFKQIRDARLQEVCGNCRFNNQSDCREGYYGVRIYIDDKGAYRVGVCIQRMDLTMPIEQFFQSDLPKAIKNFRKDEYMSMIE